MLAPLSLLAVTSLRSREQEALMAKTISLRLTDTEYELLVKLQVAYIQKHGSTVSMNQFIKDRALSNKKDS